ncbi:hypothetical protein NM688_g5582 [Phlebia brevispora]|uniref:Uncharacterized protein n=1 Tax=Phlebia brevispora TaxID=194682 RepID=A0ACC1STC0_9APHY|nr:hypothetical protein NM688_g5582 [Phlebia brevispora]
MSSREFSTGINVSLVDALRAVAKQLQDISDRLPPASKSPGEKQGDGDRVNEEAEALQEEVWETTRDTIQEQNQDIVDNWKDELNNLLVFAGLFSAVVTAFTVESYSWLQQDPGDASNILLAYISVQLSSFSSTPGFINSSAPALPLKNVTSSFVPAAFAVPVNTLWVLSLTLSLIAAFFAIAVQQWLRHLRLPSDISARQAVQLLSLRSDGVETWQVPGIISLLPLLLQIAVVFFLLGLFLLLRSLNTTVTVIFSVVALVGLLAFLTSTLVPLFISRCPYKSPVVPTILIVLQWLSYPLALLAVPSVFPINTILQSSIVQHIIYRLFPHPILAFIERINIWYLYDLPAYIKSFGRHIFVDMGRFWLRLECLTMLNGPDLYLERLSIARILLTLRSHVSFVRVISCLKHVPDFEWHNICDSMIKHSLIIFFPYRNFDDILDYYSAIRPSAMPYIHEWLSTRHRYFTWKANLLRDWTRDSSALEGDRYTLVLSSELRKSGLPTFRRFTKHLLHICAHQVTDEDCTIMEVIPIILVFRSMEAGYALAEEEARIIIGFAFKNGTRNAVRNVPWANHAHALLFASCKAAFVAMNNYPPLGLHKGRTLVGRLADILRHEEWKRHHTSMLKNAYGPQDWGSNYPQDLPAIHQTLSRTLVNLVEQGILLQGPECPSIQLLSILREIYEGVDGDHFVQARQNLDRFAALIPYGGDLGLWERELLDERLQRGMRALVLVERRERESREHTENEMACANLSPSRSRYGTWDDQTEVCERYNLRENQNRQENLILRIPSREYLPDRQETLSVEPA